MPDKYKMNHNLALENRTFCFNVNPKWASTCLTSLTFLSTVSKTKITNIC